MSATLVWFLILTNWNGGILAIEQPSREACVASREYIMQWHEHFTAGAVCVQGNKP